MDFEPMDVDKSASSTSKMDISCNDSDSDLLVLNNDLISHNNITIKKEVPDPEFDYNQTFSTGIFSTTWNNPENNSEVKVKTEKPENLDPEFSNQVFDSPRMSSTPDVTKIKKNESLANPAQFNPVKTFHIRKKSLERKETGSKFVYFITGILVLFLSVAIYKVMCFKCAEDINLSTLRKSFTENLFGQSAACNKIIESLNMDDKNKIIFLYGGTGVGKTFAVSLILDQMRNSANVYHYAMPSFADTFSPELMLGLTICSKSVLVVDDLTANDMHIASHIKAVIAKGEKLGKNITIILVFNCDTVHENFVKKCDDSFHAELEQSFRHIAAEKYFVKFQPLQQDDLKKCVQKELGDRKVNEQEMNKILKNFDVSLDGCKGVYTKIKLRNVV